MHFPNTTPEHDPINLWTLQKEILAECVRLLGERDLSKIVYQPQFLGRGAPILINTPNFDGAWASLGDAGRSEWSETTYQLGHETVHLLNPEADNTNRFEEGIAELFAHHAQAFQGFEPYPFTMDPALSTGHLGIEGLPAQEI